MEILSLDNKRKTKYEANFIIDDKEKKNVPTLSQRFVLIPSKLS